jgi:hypothetical protein
LNREEYIVKRKSREEHTVKRMNIEQGRIYCEKEEQ